jgi:hypothetical protein
MLSFSLLHFWKPASPASIVTVLRTGWSWVRFPVWAENYFPFSKMEAACSHETLVSSYKTTGCHNPEDHNLTKQHHEKKSSILWDIMPYSWLCFPPAFTLVSCSTYSSTLKMEAICFFKLQLTFNGLHGVISQRTELLNQRCENVKPYIAPWTVQNSYARPVSKQQREAELCIMLLGLYLNSKTCCFRQLTCLSKINWLQTR